MDAVTQIDLFLKVANLEDLPSFNAIFCPIPRSFEAFLAQLRAAYLCHIPVIFEGEISVVSIAMSDTATNRSNFDSNLDSDHDVHDEQPIRLDVDCQSDNE